MGVYITMKEGQHEYNRINLKSVVAVFLLVFCTFFDAAAQASGTFTDSRDERSYKWIKIGDQTWMAENLSYKPESEGWFIYDNKEENYNQYGCLYTWETAKNVCPAGWHLPDQNNLRELFTYIGRNAGSKLKAKHGWLLNGNGNDQYGFAALPAGKHSQDKFTDIEYLGFWWTATKQALPSHIKREEAIMLYLSCSLDSAYAVPQTTHVALSVRCLKENSQESTPQARE